MSVTISELAKKLNLSKSTVSYALNGGPRSISPEVKARVLAAAKEVGFRPSPLGQALAAKRSNTIGFVPGHFESGWMFSQFATNLLSRIYAEAHKRTLHILLPSGYDPNRVDETRDKLLSAPVDGFILLLPGELESLKDLIAMSLPMVAIAAKPNALVPTINADNRGGATFALEHLLALGHQEIGVIGSTQGPDTTERLRVFEEYQKAGRLQTRPEWVLDAGPWFEEGLRAANLLLQHSQLPSAIVCVNDIVATAVIRVALERGIRIPQDLSIVGFDDDTAAQMSLIPLTTIRQPITAMAQAAVESIVLRIQGEDTPDRLLPTTLVPRATTAPLSSE